MRTLVFSIFFCASIVTTAQELLKPNTKKLHWENNYKLALSKAKNEKKPLLVYFKGSDWCGPCKKLDKELFATEKFKKIASTNFVLYEADIPMNQDLVEKNRLAINKKLAKKFKVSSYPTLLFLNKKQRVIGLKKGLIITEYYYPFFQSIIKKYK